MHVLALGLAAALFVCEAQAQAFLPPMEAKPVFRPGLYATETRYSPSRYSIGQICVAATDIDAYRDEVLTAARNSLLYNNGCELHEDAVRKDGFAFTLRCKQRKIVHIVNFSKNTIVDTTGVDIAPFYSYVQKTMRRINDCELDLSSFKRQPQ